MQKDVKQQPVSKPVPLRVQGTNSAPLSPYVRVNVGPPTPPPTPPLDDDDKKSSNGQSVQTGAAIVDDFSGTLGQSSVKMSSPVGIPLKFLKQLGECLQAAPLSDVAKRNCFVELVGAADRLVLNRYQGLQGLHERCFPDAVRKHKSHPDYSQFNLQYKYGSSNGTSIALAANATYPFGGGTDAPFVTTNVNAAYANYWVNGDDFGSMDPDDPVIRLHKMHLRYTFYAGTKNLIEGYPAGTGSGSVINPIEFPGHSVRIIVVRDKWGGLANGTSISPSSCAPTLCEIGVTGQTSPLNYNALFYTPPISVGSPSPFQNFIQTGLGVSGTNSINKMRYSVLTQGIRFEILHDSYHENITKLMLLPFSSSQACAWYGMKTINIELEPNLLSVYGLNYTAGNVMAPLTNAVYVLFISNINAATLAATSPNWTGPLSNWMPTLNLDTDSLYTGIPVLPRTDA